MQITYDPLSIESKWRALWEGSGYFLGTSGTSGSPYTIMLPPPNVTGTLHMGHGFQASLMDALIRYRHMCGDQVLWQAGTDHAGIATQMVVERLLAKEGKLRQAIGRAAFLKRTWAWKAQSEGTIQNQLKRMGASLDWTRACFSLDPKICRAVNKAFMMLYQAGLIYKGKRLVNWDPTLGTAISDLEVVSQTESGFLWHVRYRCAADQADVVVATTRPETLLGDVAIAVHPEDSRYRHLIGKSAQVPLTDRTIPIIADESVDPDFGTGCLKITPAHDFNDYQVGKRHHLSLINILTPDGCLNAQVPKAYRGMTCKAARTRIVDDLKRAGLLVDVVPHTLNVPRGDRTGAIIEPYLTDQWYVKTKPLARAAILALEQGAIRFIPENWGKVYLKWLENIEDWCISRQLWWGHRIPVWYDELGKTYVGENEASVRETHALGAHVVLRQDADVLDTWFSASLWPFATLGWPEETPDFCHFYPTSVLVTGFDILFFWVARMVMMGIYFTGKVPFKTVYVTGLIRDSEGHKMSKSRGNVLDPIDLIDGISVSDLIKKRTYGLMQPDKAQKIAQATQRDFPKGITPSGTDALRFTYCALANTGRDIRFDVQRLAGYRNFCNKIWNVARYVLTQIAQMPSTPLPFSRLHEVNRWIRHVLQETISQVHAHFAQYRFDLLAQTLHDFIWHSYCDWYVELCKCLLKQENLSPLQKAATCHTLQHVLGTAMQLLHPVMPFITEEVWSHLFKQAQPSSILQAPYPRPDPGQQDPDAKSQVDWLQKVIVALRKARAQMGLSPAKTITLWAKGSELDQKQLTKCDLFIKTLAKVQTLTFCAKESDVPVATLVPVDTLTLYIPLADNLDIPAELARLHQKCTQLNKNRARLATRLQNAAYLKKAPQSVVKKDQLLLKEIDSELTKLQAQQATLEKL